MDTDKRPSSLWGKEDIRSRLLGFAGRMGLILVASVIMAVNIKSFVEAGGLFPGGFNGLTLLIQRSVQPCHAAFFRHQLSA